MTIPKLRRLDPAITVPIGFTRTCHCPPSFDSCNQTTDQRPNHGHRDEALGAETGQLAKHKEGTGNASEDKCIFALIDGLSDRHFLIIIMCIKSVTAGRDYVPYTKP